MAQDFGLPGQVSRINPYALARDALAQIGADVTWRKWMAVAAGVKRAREEALSIVGTARPVGAAYCKAFGEILKREKLNKIDSAVRSHLLQIIENLEKIREWRAKLSESERQRWTHPTSVWRHWSESARHKKHLPKERAKMAKEIDEELEIALAENERLRQELARAIEAKEWAEAELAKVQQTVHRTR